MYTPDTFKETNLKRLHALMRRYPFALLLTAHDGEIAATHLPFMLDAERGALVVFTGPHAYISPSWYESPVTVPTWNYAVVHAYGRPIILRDKICVRAMLERLVAEHEARIDPPWSTAQADRYVDEQLDYIVAFEMTIERLKGKFKLNQNRSRNDQEGVVRALAGSDDPLKREVAELMRTHLASSKK